MALKRLTYTRPSTMSFYMCNRSTSRLAWGALFPQPGKQRIRSPGVSPDGSLPSVDLDGSSNYKSEKLLG
jgi:hypothetical protein